MSRKYSSFYIFAAVLALGSALLIALDLSPFRSLSNETYAIARVNDTAIPMAEYVRALNAMQAGLERPLTEEDKSRALTILIDEELIVQEALRLNLASDDRLVRKNLIQALINSVILLESGQDVSDQALRAFYEEEKALFSRPITFTVNALRVIDKDTIDVFFEALHDGVTFSDAGRTAQFEAIEIPAGIPAGKLGEALGGKARDAILAMTPGDIAGPIESTGGDIFIWLLKRDGGEQPFAEVKDSVVAEWQRRQEEQALARYLERLRKQARIKQYPDEAMPIE
ncbi:MAG: peptidylprolyl isomerase [Gammaproteobacteria bacterium]|nr:peptidylprolyl isomerase [Gammaproteobacteria bacterium]NNC58016.1 peptidyl-prolyl cis-trans isomerase [Woeseiaceae bacterium]